MLLLIVVTLLFSCDGAAQVSRSRTGEKVEHGEKARVGPECNEAFVAGQKYRQAQELIRARDAFRICARKECPPVYSRRCVQWWRELEVDIPSLVVLVREADGNDFASVRVIVDGALKATKLNGRGIELDPGVHVVRLVLDNGIGIDRSVILAQGDRNHKLELKIDRSGYGEAQRDPVSINVFYAGVLATILGGVAGVASGSAALVRSRALKDSCVDGVCTTDRQSEIDELSLLSHTSTIGFSLAGVGAVTSLIGYLVFVGDRDAKPDGLPQVRLSVARHTTTLSVVGTF